MEDNNQKHEPGQANDFEFLQEKIKERPISRRKLLKRTLITASMALLFGLIACVTFLLLEPILNNWLYPEEEPKVVTFPQDKDEMLPEEMLKENEITLEEPSSDDGELTQQDTTVDDTEEKTTHQTEENEEISVEVEETTVTEEEPLRLTEYQILYDELNNLYREVSKSIVTVTGVKSDVDWFNNPYQQEGNISGVIVANNNRELLILTKKSSIYNADSIIVEFCNGTSSEAIIKKYDSITDMAVIAVELKSIDPNTMDAISIASIGRSGEQSLTGMPAIAIGNILGYKDNACYGIVTSIGNVITLADSQYKLLTTDIYGSQNPTGILVNMEGQVIGIIDNSYNHSDTKNLVSAIGISEMKGMIEKLSNGYDIPYIGMYVQDITFAVRTELGLPTGAYISNIDIDSPAMIKGVQKGDIVVQVGNKSIKNASDYMDAVRECKVDENVKLVIKRASKQNYQTMEITVTPTLQPEKKKK